MSKKKALKKYTIYYMFGEKVLCTDCDEHVFKMVDITSDITKETASFPMLYIINKDENNGNKIPVGSVIDIAVNFDMDGELKKKETV